jgi:hypothetical protein
MPAASNLKRAVSCAKIMQVEAGVAMTRLSSSRMAVAVGSVSVLIGGVLATGSTGARAVGPRVPAVPSAAALKPPAGTSNGSLLAVAAVPHSTDVWTIGSIENELNGAPFSARRHHGHWQRFNGPKIGNFGEVTAIAAGSSKAVWLAGARPDHGPNVLPTIWRWSGKKFVVAKLPKLRSGEVAITSISASSATNAWAVGQMFQPGSSKQVALHWNGKTWAAVAMPEDATAVATSGPLNAWAIGDDGTSLLHWNGKAWSEAAFTPLDVVVNAIATTSPHLAYAVGGRLSPTGSPLTVIRRFDGKTWSTAPLGTGARGADLLSVSIHGTSAWAVGAHTTANSSLVPVIVHTTGGTWRSQRPAGGNLSDYTLNAVSVASANRAYAVGNVDTDTANLTFFDAFTGHSWKGEPSRF